MPVLRLTADDSCRMQQAVAASLTHRGVTRGERVLVPATGTPAYLSTVLGALRIGVVPVPVNPSWTAAELGAVVEDCDAALVMTPEDLEQWADGDPGRVALAPHPLARPLLYTSGTTGRPKGVWSGVLSDGDARRLFEEEVELWELHRSDRHLVCAPLYHSAPLRFATHTLLVGGEVLLPGGFAPGVVAAAINSGEATTTFMAPPHLQRVLPAVDRRRTGRLRLLAHAGAPCPEPLKRRCLQVFREGAVTEFYGSTEGQFTVCTDKEWLEKPGSVGRARPGRRLHIDVEGGDVVWCQAPTWARFSYWRDPEKTCEAWRGDAFTVGDLGAIDDDGYLYLRGRRDDLIISGGVNVYPAELEQVFRRLAGVDDVAVFPRSDEDWGQRVCAAVVGTISEAELRRVAAEAWSPAKRPKEYALVESIPRTEAGKLRRGRLAQSLGLDS